MKLYMPVWTLQELLDCHNKTTLYSSIPALDITNGFDKFGGIPRYVMSTGTDRMTLVKRLQHELQHCNSKDLINSLGNLDTINDSHVLVQYVRGYRHTSVRGCHGHLCFSVGV